MVCVRSGWPPCRAECSCVSYELQSVSDGQPLHATTRSVNCASGNCNVVTAPVRRGSRKRARPNGVPAATCPLDRARGLLASDRGQKPIGSGSIEHANWRGNVGVARVYVIGSHIYEIYHLIYELVCGFRCRGGSNTNRKRGARVLLSFTDANCFEAIRRYEKGD